MTIYAFLVNGDTIPIPFFARENSTSMTTYDIENVLRKELPQRLDFDEWDSINLFLEEAPIPDAGVSDGAMINVVIKKCRSLRLSND